MEGILQIILVGVDVHSALDPPGLNIKPEDVAAGIGFVTSTFNA